MFVCPVDDNEVVNMLNKLDKSKSSGPNSIPTNKFPDLLKIAKVCPVFKKEERNFRENYRPISLL